MRLFSIWEKAFLNGDFLEDRALPSDCGITQVILPHILYSTVTRRKVLIGHIKPIGKVRQNMGLLFGVQNYYIVTTLKNRF